MKPEDKTKFASMITASWKLYGKSLDSEMLTIFWETLKKYELEEFSSALSRHTANPDTGQFAPKPADIVKFIEGSGDDLSMRAWTKVEATIKRKGGYVQDLVFDDHIIHAVVRDMGGWIEICKVMNKELPFMRNDFCKRYRGYMLKGEFDYPAKLRGLIGDGEPVLMIGDQSKAESVMLGGSNKQLEMAHINDAMVKLLGKS